MMEKRRMRRSGVLSLVLGVLTIVFGISVGVLGIVNGGKLIRHSKKLN